MFIKPFFLLALTVLAAKKKNNNNNNNNGNANALPANNRPAGNTPACQTVVNGAASIVGVMQLVLNNVNQRGAAATNQQTLNANLNDLATYEQAVQNIQPMVDFAAACNGGTQVNAAYLNVRSAWYTAKTAIRTAQVATGQPDGTSGIPPTANTGANPVSVTANQAQAILNSAAQASQLTLQNLPAPGTGAANAQSQQGGLPNGAQNGQNAAGTGTIQPAPQVQAPSVQ